MAAGGFSCRICINSSQFRRCARNLSVGRTARVTPTGPALQIAAAVRTAHADIPIVQATCFITHRKTLFISNPSLRKCTSARTQRLLFIFPLILSPALLSGATLTIDLGAASGFAVLAGSGITVARAVNTTSITGDIGSVPTPAITGLENVVLTGTNHAGGEASESAQDSLVAAYANAAGRAYTKLYAADFNLGGQTLTSGVYNSASSLSLTGSLTLDAKGDPNAVWIFQAGSTLTTASSSEVNLVGGAQASNIFWQVGSSATLGTYTNFAGSILAHTSITVTTGATVDGRMLASGGAVTLDSNTIAVPQGLPAAPTQAVDVFWTGSGTSWNELGSWSTDRDITNLDPALMPGSTETVTFNLSALSSAQTINLDAAQSIRGLSFTSEGTIQLQAGGEEQVLTLADGGINKSGSGEVSIGSVTAGQQVRLELSADQSWTSNDHTSALTILNDVSASMTTSTDRVLTLNGASTAANTVAGAIGDHESGVMTLHKSGTGNWTLAGNNTYSGDTLVSAGTLLVTGKLSATAVTVEALAAFAGIGILEGDLDFAATAMLHVADISDAMRVTGNVTFGSGFGIANLSGIDWDEIAMDSAFTILSTTQAFSTSDISNLGVENAVVVGSIGRVAYFQNGSLQVVVIPEPSALLLGGLAAMLLLRRRR